VNAKKLSFVFLTYIYVLRSRYFNHINLNILDYHKSLINDIYISWLIAVVLISPDKFIIKIYVLPDKLRKSENIHVNFIRANLDVIHHIDRTVRYPPSILLKVNLGDRAIERRRRDKLTAMSSSQQRCTLAMR